MRLLAPACLLVVVSSACGYPCAEHCRSLGSVIAEHGYNPDSPTGSGGLDPDEVCSRDAIQRAATCEECRAAFAEELRLVSDRMVCDCPVDGDTIFVNHEDCVAEPVPADAATCQQASSPEQNELDRQCLEG